MSAFYKWSGYPLTAFLSDLGGLVVIVAVAMNESSSWNYLPAEIAGIRTLWAGLGVGLAFYIPGVLFHYRKKRRGATAAE